MDRQTLAAYEVGAASYATEWHRQPSPTDLHTLVKQFFGPGLTADVGCGSGREVAWLAANGFQAIGYDAAPALLAQARARYPGLAFERAALPELAGLADASFDNVLCETVIMHLAQPRIAQAAARLMGILKPTGTLYLSWRVAESADLRDTAGRLYSAFPAELVREALAGADIVLDEETMSVSSGRKIHRMVARKSPAQGSG